MLLRIEQAIRSYQRQEDAAPHEVQLGTFEWKSLCKALRDEEELLVDPAETEIEVNGIRCRRVRLHRFFEVL